MKIKTATIAAGRLVHEGTLCLAKMTRRGVRIDEGYLLTEIKNVEAEIGDIKKRMGCSNIWPLMQRAFRNRADLGSREQLGHVVFDQMKIPRGRSMAKKNRDDEYGGRKKPQLDEASFSNCDLEFVKDFFKWKKLEKLLTTYFYDLRRNLVDGRVHPFYHLNRVRSYRSSASDPNTQNVPTRNKWIARKIRRCYIPDPGCDIVECDYGQNEVRAACVYTKDQRLIRDFAMGRGDAHGDTAELIFGTKAPPKGSPRLAFDLWKVIRDWIKNRFVFPQFFGSTYHNCAPHIWDAVERKPYPLMPDGVTTVKDHLASQGIVKLGDPEEEIPAKDTFLYRVSKVEHGFWNDRFKTYTAWKDKWYLEYLRKGFAECLSGFVFSGLMGRNDVLNYPIQGFAFHWLLEACIELTNELERLKMGAYLWAEVHDSHDANVPHGERDDFINLATDIMLNHVPKVWPSIDVPLSVSVEVCPDGSPWSEKKDFVNQGGVWCPKAA